MEGKGGHRFSHNNRHFPTANSLFVYAYFLVWNTQNSETTNSILIVYQSLMFVQDNNFMRLSSTIQFIHLIVFIQSLPIYRIIKYNTFLFWTLNQTRFSQFGSTISHKFLIFILNIDHTKDWNMLAKPIWVVMIEKSQSMIGS